MLRYNQIMSAAPLKQTSERATESRLADPSALSPSKWAALTKVQAAHRRANQAARKVLVVPDGFRSVAHLLDTVAEAAGRVFGGQADLARYLGVNTKSVSR